MSKNLLILVCTGLLAVAVYYSYWLQIEPTKVQPVPTVSEIAPGVFVRHIQYHSANQTFVVFEEFVVVFDPGAVSEAPGLIEAIRDRTDRPIRYVVSSHFHPDHAAGAPLFEKAGAEVLAGAPGHFDYENWARDSFQSRVDENVAGYEDLQYPTFTYLDESLVLDDGQQRLEIHHYGHGHTAGDLVGWLPNHEILLVSDLSNNGPLNLANADLNSWVNVLGQLLDLPIQIVVPGHGEPGGPELLAMNRHFLSQLLEDVDEMVKCGKRYEQVLDEIQIPFYEEWSGVAVRDNPANVKRAFLEVGGTIPKESRLRALWRKFFVSEKTSC